MDRERIGQIHPNAFCHPADRQASEALSKVPLLPEALRLVSRLKIEEQVRAHFLFHSIQLGPRQIPTIWRMVHEVAESLCMPPPDVYISGEGGANAFAFGVERHTVALTSGLVDMMTDRELRAIVTHEMGHILCQHMLYRHVGLALAGSAASQMVKLLPSRLVNESLSRALYAWYRFAEYSADRAALLVLDDPEPLASCLGRLAGLPKRFASEFDLRLFAEQVRVFESSATLWTRFVTFDLGAFSSHPEPARRAVAILEWARSEEYQRIRAGDFLTRMQGEASQVLKIAGVRSCELCGRPVGEKPICSYCQLPQDPAFHAFCRNGHVNATAWKFCKSCGDSLREEPGHTETPGR